MLLSALVLAVGILQAIASRPFGFRSSRPAQEPRSRETDGPLVNGRRALANLLGASEEPKLSFMQKHRLKEVFRDKLSKVPIYMVTTMEGAPFLASHMGLHSGEWHVYAAKMYLDTASAQKAKAEMENLPGAGKDKIRILPLNLHRGFLLAREAPAPTGVDHPELSKKTEAKMVYAFQPTPGFELLKANSWSKLGNIGHPKVPLYTADGLYINKGGQKVRPMFMSSEDCAKAMAKHNLKKRTVYNGLSMLNHLHDGIEKGDPNVASDLLSIEIVPPSAEFRFGKELRQDLRPGSRRAKIVQ